MPGPNGNHPLTAPPLTGILGKNHALAVAVGRDDQQAGVGPANDFRSHDLVPSPQRYRLDSGGATAHGTDLVQGKAQRLTSGRHDQDILRPLDRGYPHQSIALLQAQGGQTVSSPAPKVAERRPLDPPAAREEDQVKGERIVGHGDDPDDAFLRLDREEVGERQPTGFPFCIGQLVHLQGVTAAPLAEKEHLVPRVADSRDPDGICLPGAGTPAAVLAAVGLQGHPADVAAFADHHQDLFLRNQVLDGDLGGLLGQDTGTPAVAVAGNQFPQFCLDEFQHLLRVSQDVLQFGDAPQGLLILFLDLFPLQRRQPAQLQIQDGLGLDLGQLEAPDQVGPGRLGVLGTANGLDHFVQIFQGDAQPFQDVGTASGPAQFEATPPDDDLLAVGDIVLEHPLERQETRLGAVHQRQEVYGKGNLHLGELEELVEDDLRLGFPLQGDDDAHTAAVRFVAQVGDVAQAVLFDQFGDAFQEAGLVHLVRKFGNDDAGAAAAGLLDVGFGPDDKVPLACTVSRPDAFLAQDNAAGGKIGAGEDAHKVLGGGLGLFDEQRKGGADLAQVMGWDIGGHAYGDAGDAVQEEVGNSSREDEGFLQSSVKVGAKVHRFLLDVAEHLLGDGGQAGFGIALGGGGISVDAAKVALAVHQRIAHGKILGHPHHGLVDGGVAVGMVAAQRIADDAGAFLERGVVLQPQLVHHIDDAPLHRLEAIAHVGQGPGHDDAHRVIEVGAAHLFGDLNGSDDAVFHWRPLAEYHQAGSAGYNRTKIRKMQLWPATEIGGPSGPANPV